MCIIGKTRSQKGFYSGNTGNFLFNLALEKFLDNAGADVVYNENIFENKFTPEYINENFDLVLFSSANFINPKCKEWLLFLAKNIKKLKIPVFFVGIGLQSPLNDVSHDFINSFKFECGEFLNAVCECGGSFSLRGYKTSEVFEKLGCKNYSVTGCPSVFLFGKNFQVNFKKVEKELLKPVINGTGCLRDKKINKIFKTYPKSVFICQDRFYKILRLNYQKNHPVKYGKLALMLRFGKTVPELLKQNRITLFEDIPDWMDYIKNEGFNFSFGTRIHGNLINILCNVPALIYACDTRVLEMAEFFKIPHIKTLPYDFDLYKMYENVDYFEFNKNYNEKAAKFQNFFDKFEIPCKIF